jgi:small nuclear ribonucleoprotein (snRNP)-like protein
MFIQNLKQENVYIKHKTGQRSYKTSNRTMFIQNIKQDNVHIKLKTGQCSYNI